VAVFVFFFFSSRRRHTISKRDWSSDVCSSDLWPFGGLEHGIQVPLGLPKRGPVQVAAQQTGSGAMPVGRQHVLGQLRVAQQQARSEERRVGKERTRLW